VFCRGQPDLEGHLCYLKCRILLEKPRSLEEVYQLLADHDRKLKDTFRFAGAIMHHFSISDNLSTVSGFSNKANDVLVKHPTTVTTMTTLWELGLVDFTKQCEPDFRE